MIRGHSHSTDDEMCFISPPSSQESVNNSQLSTPHPSVSSEEPGKTVLHGSM